MQKSRNLVLGAHKRNSYKQRKYLRKMEAGVKTEYHNFELNKYQKLRPIQEVEEHCQTDYGFVTVDQNMRGNNPNIRTGFRDDGFFSSETVSLHSRSRTSKHSFKGIRHDGKHMPDSYIEPKSSHHGHKRYSNIIVDDIMTEAKKSTKKKSPPSPRPDALCFSMNGSMASHTDVLNEVRSTASSFKGVSVRTVQFLPCDQRCVVTLDSMKSRDRLSGIYVQINGLEVQLRRYDDILKLEYRKYLRANGLIEMVKSIP